MDSPPTPEIFYDAQDPIDDDGGIQQLPAPEDQPEISLHALAGFTTPQTMQVRGFFKNSLLQYSLILVALTTSLT